MSTENIPTDELPYLVCTAFEPTRPLVTAREARASVKNFSWCNCCDYSSPAGWWVAEIGTDHGPPEEDDDPIRWGPLAELIDDIAVAWRAVDAIKEQGWLLHILQMTDGWVVNGTRHDVLRGDWVNAVLTSDMVQEHGDTAPEAICRAVVAAARIHPFVGPAGAGMAVPA